MAEPKAFWIERAHDRFEERLQVWADRQQPGLVGEFLSRLSGFPSVMLVVLGLVGPMWGLLLLGEYLVEAHGISRKAAGAIGMVGGLVTGMLLVFVIAIRRMQRLAARGQAPL